MILIILMKQDVLILETQSTYVQCIIVVGFICKYCTFLIRSIRDQKSPPSSGMAQEMLAPLLSFFNCNVSGNLLSILTKDTHDSNTVGTYDFKHIRMRIQVSYIKDIAHIPEIIKYQKYIA